MGREAYVLIARSTLARQLAGGALTGKTMQTANRYAASAVALLAVAIGAFAIESEQRFIGDWDAVSNNHVAISGDMTVNEGTIRWAKHGTLTTTRSQRGPDFDVLTLEREVDCGRWVRLGPLRRDELEVAFYSSAPEELEKDTEGAYPTGCSWGIYQHAP